MKVWRKEGGLGRGPEGGGFATGLWHTREDKAGKVNWDQIMRTLACQERTSLDSGDPWRTASPHSFLPISV